jgi:hypothetical protein
MPRTQLDEQTVTTHSKLEGIGPVAPRVLSRAREGVRRRDITQIEYRLHGRGAARTAYLSQGHTSGRHLVTLARASHSRRRIAANASAVAWPLES